MNHDDSDGIPHRELELQQNVFDEGLRNPELAKLLGQLNLQLDSVSETLTTIENNLSIQCEEREVFAQTHVSLNALTQMALRLQSQLDSMSPDDDTEPA